MRKNYFSEEQQKTMKKLYKSDEKRENPKSLQGMMMGFQGRSLVSETERSIESLFPKPSLATPVGIAKKVYYDSDKRDPASPYGDGKQGVMKRFVHDHDKSDVMLYELNHNGNTRDALPKKTVDSYVKKNDIYQLPNTWTETCAWIGKLVCVEYDCNKGYMTETFDNFDLFVWDDMKTLMAVPPMGRIHQVLIWRGPDMKVNWRGIIH